MRNRRGQCLEGRVALKPGSHTCKECERGTVASVDGTRCAPCPVGRSELPVKERRTAHASCSECEPGWFGPRATYKACTRCLPGQFSAGAATTCRECEAGQHQALPGMDTCESCGADTWSAMGAKSCLACPQGRHSTASFNSKGCSPNRNTRAPTPNPVKQPTCVARTTYADWSDCNRNCGGGTRYRYRETVTCTPKRTVKVYRQQQHCNTKRCLPCLAEEHCDKQFTVTIPLPDNMKPHQDEDEKEDGKK